MEKRVVPRTRPVSRGSDPPFSSSSSSSSSPSFTPSRTMEVLPSEPAPLSLPPLSRPTTSSNSSRPHSPSLSSSSHPTSTSLSSLPPHSPSGSSNFPSVPSRPPSSPSHSPIISPSNGRRRIIPRDTENKITEQEKKKEKESKEEQNGVFITSLRGESSMGMNGYKEEEDYSIDFNTTNESENEGQYNYETMEDKEDMIRMEAEQAARRAELDSYMVELQHKKDVIVFPKNFTEIMETFEPDQMGENSFWAKYMMDPSIDDPWVVDEKLAKGLERIRKLDIILAKKTKQAKELQRAMNPKLPGDEKSKKDKTGKTIPGPPQLTNIDEARINAILAAADGDLNDYYNNFNSDAQTDDGDSHSSVPFRVRTPFEELEGLLDVDLKLADLIPTDEWESKGLAHMLPTSANSRASSLSSSLSYASTSSYASYLSRASRTSMGKQASKELEKEREEEMAREKARMREIDVMLRALSHAEAQLARANEELCARIAGDAGDAQEVVGGEGEDVGRVEIEKATPEKIRKLVRMFSRSSLAS